MRNWKDSLFFQGIDEIDVDRWEQELRQREITLVVCLVPSEELTRISPTCAAWIEQHEGPPEPGPWQEPVLEIRHLPIPEGGAPEEQHWHRFWHLAEKVAERLSAGQRVVVLCRSGKDRTGLFAVAILRKMGLSMETSLRMMSDAGSPPEQTEQFAFLSTTACDCTFADLGISVGTVLTGPQGLKVIAEAGGTSQLVRVTTPEHECVCTLSEVSQRLLGQDLTIPAELLRMWKLNGETLLARCLSQIRDMDKVT
jgi:hypothetical protein